MSKACVVACALACMRHATHLEQLHPLLGRQQLVAQALVAPVGVDVLCEEGHGVDVGCGVCSAPQRGFQGVCSSWRFLVPRMGGSN